MEKLIGIYKIISPTERVYIGQSINIENRWKNYSRLYESGRGQILLYNSFLKYGVENHTFEIVEECSKEDLNCRERYWQEFYTVLNGGLNCILQECGKERRVLSEETLRKKSEASKGERNGMFGRSGSLNPNYGKIMSEEDKSRLSVLMKGRYTGDLNPFYGQKHSIETIEILSTKAKEKVGVLNSFYGKNHTEEYKQKSSKRMNEYFENNPEAKANLKEKLSIGLYFTPEGIFMSKNDASKANKVAKSTIRNRCVIKSDKKVGYNGQIPIEYRGEKTWREHGWYFELKNIVD